MANSPNFGALLSKAPSEIERPKPLPQGTYTCVVKGLPRFDQSSKKKTDYAEYTLQPIAAGEDVDVDDLKAMGGFKDKTIKATYYITEAALWRLKEFLADCGLEEGEYDSLQEMVEAASGCQVLVTMKHRASEDGQAVFAEIGSTAAVE